MHVCIAVDIVENESSSILQANYHLPTPSKAATSHMQATPHIEGMALSFGNLQSLNLQSGL